jgi:hypothetical protein
MFPGASYGVVVHYNTGSLANSFLFFFAAVPAPLRAYKGEISGAALAVAGVGAPPNSVLAPGLRLQTKA